MTLYASTQTTPTSDEFDSGATVANKRAKVERELIGHLLRNRRRGMKWADEVGVTAQAFDQPDLSAMFVAIRHTANQTPLETMKALQFVLRHLGYWDERVPRGSRGMFWSSETLAEMEFEGREPACPAFIPLLLSELLEHCHAGVTIARTEAA